MFGPDDAFLNTLVQLLRRLPIYPMFGRGETRMQPADVEDVGEAVAELMQRTAAEAITVECGGPRVHTYEELLRTITRAAKRETHIGAGAVRRLASLSVGRRDAAGRTGSTRNQVELMEIDTVVSAGAPALPTGISPRALEDILQTILRPA